jgi:hypothetical protein
MSTNNRERWVSRKFLKILAALWLHDALSVGENAATNGRTLVVLVQAGDWAPLLEFRTHLPLLPKGWDGIHVIILKGQPANTILLVGEEFNV